MAKLKEYVMAEDNQEPKKADDHEPQPDPVPAGPPEDNQQPAKPDHHEQDEQKPDDVKEKEKEREEDEAKKLDGSDEKSFSVAEEKAVPTIVQSKFLFFLVFVFVFFFWFYNNNTCI